MEVSGIIFHISSASFCIVPCEFDFDICNLGVLVQVNCTKFSLVLYQVSDLTGILGSDYMLMTQ